MNAQDQGLIKLAQLLNEVDNGTINLQVEKFKDQVAHITMPYTRKVKTDNYTNTIGYIVEKLRDAQLAEYTGTFTITIQLRKGEPRMILDNGYEKMMFQVEP